MLKMSSILSITLLPIQQRLFPNAIFLTRPIFDKKSLRKNFDFSRGYNHQESWIELLFVKWLANERHLALLTRHCVKHHNFRIFWCQKAQFQPSFGRITRNSAETVPFQKKNCVFCAVGTIDRASHYRKSPTRSEQDLNLRRIWVHIVYRMKFCGSDNNPSLFSSNCKNNTYNKK